MTLIGKAPLTVIRLEDGSRQNIGAGVFVPASIDPADAERLLEDGYLVEIEIVDEEPEPAPAVPTTIEEILTEVGDDAGRAQAFLGVELEKGDKARKSLVEKLEAIIEAASS